MWSPGEGAVWEGGAALLEEVTSLGVGSESLWFHPTSISLSLCLMVEVEDVTSWLPAPAVMPVPCCRASLPP